METPMLSHLFPGELPQVLAGAQNSPAIARIKRMLLVLLALWMSYFLIVNWFLHALNKIAFLGIPLGTCLAVQGAAIMFVITLFRFARSAG
jgi:putative solute:sodium symporter small subunit